MNVVLFILVIFIIIIYCQIINCKLICLNKKIIKYLLNIFLK